MAWDLWSSSYDQVVSVTSLAYDGNYYDHAEWQCDFYFGCGRDVIDEDALNEESCVQVLRILIAKADTEIEELEKDLLSLQNELTWTEHEKWPEICCSALTERINWLGVAISTLKNDHADDKVEQLLLHNKPAETLHEIVKALQRDHCQDTHGQHLDVNILNPIANDEQTLDKDSSSVDSNIIMKEEGKELCGTSGNSRSSEILLELHEKRSDDPEKIEELLAESLMTSPHLGVISCAPDHSDVMKLSGISDNKITENEEVRRSQLITTDTGQILNLFFSKGNGNIPREAKKENAIINEKDVSSDDCRLATGVKGRKKCFHSRLGASKQQKSGNSDLDEKLCDFAPKTARRACKKESNVAPAEDLDSLNLPLQVVYPQELCLADTESFSFNGSNGNNSRQMMNIENTSLIHAENSALISLLEMQTKSAPYTGLQLTDEVKQAQGLKSKIAVNLSESNLSFPSKLKAQGKRKAEFEAFSAREPHDSPTEFNPNTSIIVSTKRQWKSKTSTGSASLNESMNRKITKRAVQPGQDETEGRAIVPYDSEFSELQKRRRVSKLPITVEMQNSTVNLDMPNSDRVSVDNGSQEDIHICKSYSLVDSHNETSALLPINNLMNLKLSILRAMAKQHNVTKYYKLPKGALVEQLVERISKR